MRAKSVVLFVIAVGCGLAASIGVSQYMEKGGVQQETKKILVAMSGINIGEKLDAQTVKLEDWPKDRVPEGAVYELAGVEGKYPRTRMYAGEPILQAKLMDSNKNSPTVTIPKGMRVISIKASVENAGGGLIQPGDRVDVVVLLRKSAEIPETGARTILKDVNVFSVDGATERSTDENGQTRALSTVSLLLKPRQAESVTLASELGRLFLTLRRPDDDVEVSDDNGETIGSLLGTSGESANERHLGSDGDFADWLRASRMQAQEPAPVVEVQAPVATGPSWKMIVLGSTGSREFLWSDDKELPTETIAAPGGSDNVPASSYVPVSTSPTPARRTPAISSSGDESDEDTSPDTAPDTGPDTNEDIPITPH